MAEQRARRDLAPRQPRLREWLPEGDSWLWSIVAAVLFALPVIYVVGWWLGWW